MAIKIDLMNKRYGRLVVVGREEIIKGKKTRWICRCDCGNISFVDTYGLKSGRAKSCGCLSLEKMTNSKIKHGDSNTRLYGIWNGMKKRCNNPNYEHYHRYGGRGIQICNEWEHNYENFKEWALQSGYKADLEIDRTNNDGNYEPSNCSWQTREKQVRNRSNTVYIEYKGDKKTLSEWCEINKTNYKLAHQRYKRGWNYERIFKLMQ